MIHDNIIITILSNFVEINTVEFMIVNKIFPIVNSANEQTWNSPDRKVLWVLMKSRIVQIYIYVESPSAVIEIEQILQLTALGPTPLSGFNRLVGVDKEVITIYIASLISPPPQKKSFKDALEINSN